MLRERLSCPKKRLDPAFPYAKRAAAPIGVVARFFIAVYTDDLAPTTATSPSGDKSRSPHVSIDSQGQQEFGLYRPGASMLLGSIASFILPTVFQCVHCMFVSCAI